MVDREVQGCELLICWPVDPLTHLLQALLSSCGDVEGHGMLEDYFEAGSMVFEGCIRKSCIASSFDELGHVSIGPLNSKQLLQVAIGVVCDALEYCLSLAVG